MENNIVRNWLGASFKDLAPELQRLHIEGGTLKGNVEVLYGKGVSKFIGKRLAKKLNIQKEGLNKLVVNISHDEKYLYWNRIFNDSARVESIFSPIGNKNNGYWIEKIGPLTMKLTVEIIDGGWHWKCLGFFYLGVPLPVWLFPNSKAYKTIEDGKYRFYVGFQAPIFGNLLSYSGVLNIDLS